MMKQICIHWVRSGTDGYGRAEWADPVEKSCRWTGQNEKYIDARGEERLSNATVFVDGVAIGDALMLGTLDDSGINLTDPLRNSGAWEIKRYDSTPNFSATITYNKAYL